MRGGQGAAPSLRTLPRLTIPATLRFDGCFAPRDATFGGFANLEVWAGSGHVGMLPVWGCFLKSSLFALKTPVCCGWREHHQDDTGPLAVLGGTGGGRRPVPEPVGVQAGAKTNCL